MRVNAFCTAHNFAASDCDRIIFCGENDPDLRNVEFYRTYNDGMTEKKVYIPSMRDEDAFAAACDYIISEDAYAVIYAANDLEETGIIEAKYKLSPIMLLHKLGVLDRCIIVGGVCLDNDDLDLMAQENIPLVLLPTASAGYGCGYAPAVAAVARGLRIGVGTGDGKYNKALSIDREIEFLRLTANADMRCENALSRRALDLITAFEKP